MRPAVGVVIYSALLVCGAGGIAAASLVPEGNTDFDRVLRGAAVLAAVVGIVLAHRQSRDQLARLRRRPWEALFDEAWLVVIVSAAMTLYVFVGGVLLVGGGYFLLRAIGKALG